MVKIVINTNLNNIGYVYHEELFMLLLQEPEDFSNWYMVEVPEEEVYRLDSDPENKNIETDIYYVEDFKAPYELWERFGKKVLLSNYLEMLETDEAWIHPDFLSSLEKINVNISEA